MIAARHNRAVQAATYAGIGSRRTPPEMLALISSLAARLAGRGWTLRTGNSPGADQAFYRGARSAGGRVELFLPWPGFEREALRVPAIAASALPRVHERPSRDAWRIAGRFHPNWCRLTVRERALLARDAEQVLGASLHAPVAFVLCWTADGGRDGAGLLDDGTGQALRIAHAHGIPVLNLGRPEHVRRWRGPRAPSAAYG